MSNPKRRPKIAIGFNQLTSYAARERLRGILRYERLNGQWDFLLDYHSLSIPNFDYEIAGIAGYIGEERRDLTDPLMRLGADVDNNGKVETKDGSQVARQVVGTWDIPW